MRRTALFLSVSVIVVLTSAALVMAQSSQGAGSERKVVTRVEPIYPELARKMRIHGIVRVEATVRPNGLVKSTRVLGGNPVLVDAAQQAISKWKFEAAQNETTQVVQLTFDAE
jgi:TonB family protein